MRFWFIRATARAFFRFTGRHAYLRGLFFMSTFEQPSLADSETADKEERRRSYMRHYQKELRQKRKRLELLLTPEDYQRLKQSAKEHRMKTATFAREAMLAYVDERFVLPDSELVAELELALRRITTDVNRIARSAVGGAALDVGRLNQRLAELEDVISSTLRDPPALMELIDLEVKRDSTLERRIRERLANLPKE